MIDYKQQQKIKNIQFINTVVQMGTKVCAPQYEGQNYLNNNDTNKQQKNRHTRSKTQTQQKQFNKNQLIGEYQLGQFAFVRTVLGHFAVGVGQRDRDKERDRDWESSRGSWQREKKQEKDGKDGENVVEDFRNSADLEEKSGKEGPTNTMGQAKMHNLKKNQKNKKQNLSVLLCFSTLDSLSFCQQLRQFASDAKSTLQKLKHEKSLPTLTVIKQKKSSPYSYLLLALLPDYPSNPFDKSEPQIYEFQKQFRTLIRSILHPTPSPTPTLSLSLSLSSSSPPLPSNPPSSLTLYLTPSSQEGTNFPTQTLLDLFFKEIMTSLARHTKIWIISPEKKMLDMVRYELVKGEGLRGGGEWGLRGLPGG